MRRHHRWVQLVATLSALLLVAVACGDDGDDDEAGDALPAVDDEEETADGETTTSLDPAAIGGTIRAEDQLSDGQAVEVEEATITGSGGWVVVHADDGGSPGQVVGHSPPIPEGTGTDVEVALDEPIDTGTYWVMLHYDAGTEELYEFPGPDAPVMEDDEVVVTPIEVTVEG